MSLLFQYEPVESHVYPGIGPCRAPKRNQLRLVLSFNRFEYRFESIQALRASTTLVLSMYRFEYRFESIQAISASTQAV